MTRWVCHLGKEQTFYWNISTWATMRWVYLAPLPDSPALCFLFPPFLYELLARGCCQSLHCPGAQQACLPDRAMLILDEFIRLGTCSLLLAINWFHLSWKKKGLVRRLMRQCPQSQWETGSGSLINSFGGRPHLLGWPPFIGCGDQPVNSYEPSLTDPANHSSVTDTCCEPGTGPHGTHP